MVLDGVVSNGDFVSLSFSFKSESLFGLALDSNDVIAFSV